MPKASEVAEIAVNGRRYRDWKSFTVRRAYGEAASSFGFTAASPVESGASWGGMKLRVGDRCLIRLAGRTVIPGITDVRQVAYDDKQHALQIHGLSKVSDIIYATVNSEPGEFKNYSLQQIANAVLQPFGIRLTLKGATAGADKPFPKVNVQVGETVFAFLERLCRFRNVFLTDDANGNLVAYRAGGRPSPIADLEEGRNIKVASITMSDEQALSKIEVKGQRPGSDGAFGDDARDVAATALNGAVNRHRPLVFMAEMPGDKADMQMRADHELAENYVTMLQGTITVQGWQRDDGSLWIEHVGQTITVRSPMIFPDDVMQLAIQGVTHKQDEGGTQSILEMVLPGRLGGGNFISASGIPNLVPGTAA